MIFLTLDLNEREIERSYENAFKNKMKKQPTLLKHVKAT
jgi:hypothetical protein